MKKRLLATILVMTMALSLAACGGGEKTPASASSAEMSALIGLLGGGGSSTEQPVDGGEGIGTDPYAAEGAGVYECVKADMYDVELELAEMFSNGVSMDLRAGGNATFHYDTTDFEMKWTLNGDQFHVEDQYNAMDGTLKDGVLILNDVLNSSMTMTFIDRSVADESTIAELTGPKLDLEMIGKYEGDWFGELVFQYGTGGYEQWIDTETLVMARFSFDEEGKVTPWLFAAVSDLDNNFKNVSGEIDPFLNELFLHFDFFYAQMDTDNVYVDFDGDVMVMYPTFDRADGKGSFQARIAMKRLHEEWTDEEAEMYPFTRDFVAETLMYDNVEDLASAFELPYPTPVPPVTKIAEGGAGTPSGAAQNAGAGQQGGGTRGLIDAEERPSKVNGPQNWDTDDLYGEGIAELDLLAYAALDTGSKWYYEDVVAYVGTKGQEKVETDGTNYWMAWFTPEGDGSVVMTFQRTPEGYLVWTVTDRRDAVADRYKELQ